MIAIEDPAERASLCGALRVDGRELWSPADARELFECVLRHRPDVVLADRALVEHAGAEGLASLATLAKDCGASVVVIGAAAADALDVETPANAIARPFTLAQLSDSIAKAFDDRIRSGDALRNARLLADLEHTHGFGTWEFDLASHTIHASEEARRVLGCAPGSNAGTIAELFANVEESDRVRIEPWIRSIPNGPVASLELSIADAHDARTIALRPLESAAGRRADELVAGVVSNVGANSATELFTHRDETLDRLTGIPRRERFLEIVGAAMKSTGDRHLAVVCIELDQFKAMAGGLSQHAGDQLLIAFAARVREALRDPSLSARVGYTVERLTLARIRRDEFAVAIAGLAHAEDAARAAQRIIQLLDIPFTIQSRDIYLTVSVGIADYPSEHATAEDLMKSAETASYCAKQQGRNLFQFFASGMNTRALERLTLESHLRRALDKGELFVHYQPKVELATRRVVGFEALVRWRHPELGVVSPAQFIPIAEESGLIVPMGEWILETACRQTRAWLDEGLPATRMAVNLSAVQFRHPGLVEMIRRALEKTRLDPRQLELELTESLLMHDARAAVEMLTRIKRAGIHLSIDDFGTGYSSLSYLKRFPIDALKIDRSFIRELTSNPDDAAIATSIILMGRSLKLRVIAEGVETPSQLALLRAMQCDEVQGYIFSPPVSADDARKFLIPGEASRFAA